MAETARILRIGIAGLGLAGSTMAQAIAAHPNAKVAAAADVKREVRENFARDFPVETYATVEEMSASANIDVVYIATPNRLHKEHAVSAAERGKHIIVEKPMALTLEECDTMIAAAEKNRVKLVAGHTHSFDPGIKKMVEIIQSGEVGPVRFINTWNYADFLYRPRRADELDTALGGGVMFNQAPHQIDIVRLLGGGLVRSVRAMTFNWDSKRPTEGAYSSFLEFNDGTIASVIYSGYDHFDSDEFHMWLGERGQEKAGDGHGSARRALRSLAGPEEETAFRASIFGYGGSWLATLKKARAERYQPHFGILIVSCEKGDLRLSRSGVLLYTDEGKREEPVTLVGAEPGKGEVIDELYDAVVMGRPHLHDGHWGKATMEVCLAILQSARERREIQLTHQKAVPKFN
jgi:phthalate 4,5-cis-dihydrodiol dehydrogenase